MVSKDPSKKDEFQRAVLRRIFKIGMVVLKILKSYLINSLKVYVAFGVAGYITAPVPKLQFYVRYLGYNLLVAWTGLLGGAFGLIFPIIGLRPYVGYAIARIHAYTAPWITGLRFRVEGTEYLKNLKNNPSIITLNHQALTDVQALGNFFPETGTIVVKKSLMYTPGLGQFLMGMRAIPITREKGQSALSSLMKVAARMKKESLSNVIFPEGTRRNIPEPELQPFKLGAFLTAIPEQLPILPVVVQNYFSCLNLRGKKWPGGNVVIRVLPPISSVGYPTSNEGASQLANHTREIMQKTLVELQKVKY